MATDRIGAAGRRDILKGLAAGTALAATGLRPGWVQAQSSEPIRLGFQVHRTGIGAAYGRWYERTAVAALKVMNEQAASPAARSSSSSRTMRPTPSAAPRWSRNSPRSTWTSSTARCSATW